MKGISLFFYSRFTLIFCEALVILFLVILLIRTLKKRGRKKEVQRAVQEKWREDELKAFLENPYAGEELKSRAANSVPYKVSFHEGNGRKKEAVSVRITETSRLSKKEYIFNIESLLRIGSNPMNEMICNDPAAAAEETQLIRQGENLYLKKAMLVSTMYFVRNRKKYEAGDNPIQLLSGDRIIIGSTAYEITFL